jgi:hypothetical protein
MDERQTLKRKIKLKTQAVRLIRAERAELREHLFLLNFKDHLEQQMKREFDSKLSLRVDAVNFLLSTGGYE